MVSRHVECVWLLKEIRLSDLGKISHKQAIEKVLSKVEYYNIAKKLKDLKLINGEKEWK